MYEYHNDKLLYEIVYSECCKHKWSVQEYKKENEKWIKGKIFKRFDNLEDAKTYAYNKTRQ